jgi:hypothetical protein
MSYRDCIKTGLIYLAATGRYMSTLPPWVGEKRRRSRRRGIVEGEWQIWEEIFNEKMKLKGVFKSCLRFHRRYILKIVRSDHKSCQQSTDHCWCILLNICRLADNKLGKGSPESGLVFIHLINYLNKK